jgi:hypothetical protein
LPNVSAPAVLDRINPEEPRYCAMGGPFAILQREDAPADERENVNVQSRC